MALPTITITITSSILCGGRQAMGAARPPVVQVFGKEEGRPPKGPNPRASSPSSLSTSFLPSSHTSFKGRGRGGDQGCGLPCHQGQGLFVILLMLVLVLLSFFISICIIFSIIIIIIIAVHLLTLGVWGQGLLVGQRDIFASILEGRGGPREVVLRYHH